jgi:cation transport ATPase
MDDVQVNQAVETSAKNEVRTDDEVSVASTKVTQDSISKEENEANMKSSPQTEKTQSVQDREDESFGQVDEESAQKEDKSFKEVTVASTKAATRSNTKKRASRAKRTPTRASSTQKVSSQEEATNEVIPQKLGLVSIGMMLLFMLVLAYKFLFGGSLNFWTWFILGAGGITVYQMYKGITKHTASPMMLKIGSWALGALIFLVFFIGSGGGTFDNSSVEDCIKSNLEGRYGYTEVHVTSLDEIDDTKDNIVYHYKAEFKQMGMRNTQSGNITFYSNGDVKDFTTLNDIHLVGNGQ